MAAAATRARALRPAACGPCPGGLQGKRAGECKGVTARNKKGWGARHNGEARRRQQQARTAARGSRRPSRHSCWRLDSQVECGSTLTGTALSSAKLPSPTARLLSSWRTASGTCELHNNTRETETKHDSWLSSRAGCSADHSDSAHHKRSSTTAHRRPCSPFCTLRPTHLVTNAAGDRSAICSLNVARSHGTSAAVAYMLVAWREPASHDMGRAR